MRGAARGRFHRHDIHAIHGFGGHPVALRLEVNVGLGFRTRERGAHGVEVVLAHEHHRQLPQRRQVHAFVEFALRDRALAEEAGGDAMLSLHLVGKGKPDRERQSPAHDRVAAVEPRFRVEDVHVPAASAAGALEHGPDL